MSKVKCHINVLELNKNVNLVTIQTVGVCIVYYNTETHRVNYWALSLAIFRQRPKTSLFHLSHPVLVI